MRAPSDTDFIVPVEGVGNFTFARKKMRDQIAIECEYSRLTEGVETVTDFLHSVATWFSDLKVLTVEAPAGWDLNEMEPDEPETYAKLNKVWSALSGKLASFRQKPAGTDQGVGAGTGANG